MGMAHYDNHFFVLDELAWKRIADEVAPAFPASDFVFIVALNNKLIYKAAFIPLYKSIVDYNIITFKVQKPNLVFVQLGYPPETPINMFTGQDLRNDPRLIEQLKDENKLIKLEN